MKLKTIYIAAAFALVISFTSCSKDDGAIPNRVSIEDVPAVSINLESSSTTFTSTIPVGDQASFSAKFKLSMYFSGATAPTKVDLVARKRNGTIGPVKVIKADVTTLPSSFTLTAADLAALFGGPLVNKDTCEIGPDIYVGSKKYEVFPTASLGNGQGVTGMSAIGFGAQLTFYVK